MNEGNIGPTTRRKEILIKSEENLDQSLSSVMKFDEFYKDNKNVEHENYYYKKPRIDKELYQADLTKFKFSNYKSINQVEGNTGLENNCDLPLKEEDLNNDKNPLNESNSPNTNELSKPGK